MGSQGHLWEQRRGVSRSPAADARLSNPDYRIHIYRQISASGTLVSPCPSVPSRQEHLTPVLPCPVLSVSIPLPSIRKRQTLDDSISYAHCPQGKDVFRFGPHRSVCARYCQSLSLSPSLSQSIRDPLCGPGSKAMVPTEIFQVHVQS